MLDPITLDTANYLMVAGAVATAGGIFWGIRKALRLIGV
jgi:hypothetical protein